ncbi:MAG TPA: hypothetical protein PKH93_05760 [Chitinophagales bacterium]|nr:hypothetical protein [Chitinophagales bacterium]
MTKISIKSVPLPLKNPKLMRLLYLWALIGISFASCKDDDPTVLPYENGFFVLNEGSFNAANASVSHISEDKSISNDIFATANNRPLGDVAQSITFYDNKAFIVVNNSQKIEVVERNTFRSLGTIQNLPSPRYLHIVSNTKGYVTNLFSNELSIINPSTYQKTGSLTLPCADNNSCWTEKMIQQGNKLYIANTGNNAITVLDTNTDVVQQIVTRQQPSDLVEDATGKIWILCLGGWCDFNTCEPAALQLLNPANNTIEKTFAYTTNDNFVAQLQLDKTNNTLYFVNNGSLIWLNANENNSNLTDIATIGTLNRTIYGFSFKDANTIYVTDATDFAQNGKVFQLNKQNNQLSIIDSFTVGIAPAKLYW